MTVTRLHHNAKYLMTDSEKKALDLFIESVYKPDFELRASAREESCYDELMVLRQKIIDLLHSYNEPITDEISA